MIGKEELFRLCKEKAIITDEELNKMYADKVADLKKKGIEEKDIEKYALSMIRTTFKKQFISPAIKFEGIIVGDMGVNDFGARRKYDDAKKVWAEATEVLRDSLIKEGLYDTMGNPLWNTDNFKKGSQINPDKEKQRQLLMLTKKDGDSSYHTSYLTLRGEKIDLKRTVFSETILLFRANLNKVDGEVYHLTQSSVTEFIESKNKTNIVDLLKTHFKSHLVRNLSELKDWHNENMSNPQRFAIVKANVVDISLDGNYSNFITIEDDSLAIDRAITCYLAKDYEINFSEGTQDAIFIGRTSLKEDKEGQEKLSINCFGVYVDDVWKIKDKQKINETEIVEEEVWG